MASLGGFFINFMMPGAPAMAYGGAGGIDLGSILWSLIGGAFLLTFKWIPQLIFFYISSLTVISFVIWQGVLAKRFYDKLVGDGEDGEEENADFVKLREF